MTKADPHQHRRRRLKIPQGQSRIIVEAALDAS